MPRASKTAVTGSMALIARLAGWPDACGSSSSRRGRDYQEGEYGVVEARIPAGGMEPRLAVLDVGRKMGGPRAARRGGRVKPDLGLDQCAPQPVEPRFLRRPATVRLAAILVAIRHLLHDCDGLDHGCRLPALSAADPSYPLAALDDRALPQALAHCAGLLPHPARPVDRQPRSAHRRRSRPLH